MLCFLDCDFGISYLYATKRYIFTVMITVTYKSNINFLSLQLILDKQ